MKIGRVHKFSKNLGALKFKAPQAWHETSSTWRTHNY